MFVPRKWIWLFTCDLQNEYGYLCLYIEIEYGYPHVSDLQNEYGYSQVLYKLNMGIQYATRKLSMNTQGDC